MFSPTACILAEVSLRLWLKCRQLGFPASVNLSFNASKCGSLSRYLTTEHFTIRLSDHAHRDDRKWDHQIIVGPDDDLEKVSAEAMQMLAQLVGGPSAAAA